MEQIEWEARVPDCVINDPLWKMKVYRVSLFLCDLAWDDVTVLFRDGRTRSLSDQMFRAIGSIGANIAEGYSRGTGKDRARFYEYALGSARESRDWYFKARHVLGDDLVNCRMTMLASICKHLLVIISAERPYVVREESETYDALP